MLFAARPHKEEVPLQVECDQYIAGERGTPIHFRTTQAANYKLLICRAQAMGQYNYKGTACSQSTLCTSCTLYIGSHSGNTWHRA